MNYYEKGAKDAALLFKVALVFSPSQPMGDKILRKVLRTVMDPKGQPHIVRTLEPYYKEYIEGNPNAFNDFDNHFHE